MFMQRLSYINKVIKKNRIPINFLLVAAIYTYSFSLLHIMKSSYYPSFVALVSGRAQAPFQYRILIPWLARVFGPYIIKYIPFIDHMNGVKTLFEFVAVFVLLLAFFLISPLLITEKALLPAKKEIIGWLSIWLLIFALPFLYLIPDRIFYFPSDIPGILFMILGLICMRRQKWLLYYSVFILGILNRETICFLTLTYLITNWNITPRTKLLAHFFTQVFLWIGVKILLWYLFHANGGASAGYADAFGLFRNSWEYNRITLSNLLSYPDMLSVYGYLWFPLIALWKSIPDRWLKSAILTVPLFHVAMLIPGGINELRIYGEMLPLVILGVVAGVANIISQRVQLRELD